MKRILFYLIVFFAVLGAYGQGGFQLPDDEDKITIAFEKVNNLIVLPVIVNGVELKLILDTGSSRTIIFNTRGIDSLNFNRGQRLKISGYGEREPFDVFFTKDNELSSNNYILYNAEILTMVDQNIDLSGFFGMDVHGLIGYDFFADHIVEIDYSKEAVVVYKHGLSIRKKLKRMTRLPMVVKGRKPYIETIVQNNGSRMQMNTLLDTGNGDALWLIPPLMTSIIPKKGFVDKLGVGMSGNVNGLRSKVNYTYLGDYRLNKVTVSIPQEESLANRILPEDSEDENSGSIGGEILSRFKVLIDYKNQFLYLRSRTDLDEGFYYNMSGIEIMEGDLDVFTVTEKISIANNDAISSKVKDQKNVLQPTQLSFKIAPKLIISYVRPASLADLAGLREGDVIIKFNNRSRNYLSRNKIVSNFFKNPYTYIKLSVRRGEEILKFKFQLVPLI